MELNFDNKDEKQYSSLSEINKLKRDLIPENFVTIENKNNSMNLNKNYYDINELDKEENNNKIIRNKNKDEKIEEKLDNSIEQKMSNDQKNDNNINNEKKTNNEEQEEIEKENSEENKENLYNIEKEKYDTKNTIEEELEKVKEEKIQDLIPLWYKCKNKEHGDKYITLDRKKINLICKNCYTSGALETNLELNQDFIDNYLKEQELKNLTEQTPKDVIKETLEENIASESEENINKSKSKSHFSEENKSEKSHKSSFFIKCLTFQCENHPYYYCEPCQDFICYHCIVQRMDEYTDKSRHYYHDIESVNYESNSFKDDIKLELDTINKINISLDFLIKNEKTKNENFYTKIKKEKKDEIFNYINNINKNINTLILQDKKKSYDKYIEKNFNNKDNIIKDLELSSNNTKSKIEKHLEEFKQIKDLMNKKDTTYDEICFIHQKYLELINNTNILMQKGNNIISQANEELKYLNNENIINKIEEEDILQKQIISEKEKSFIQSLSSNSKRQGSYKLNRYVGYKHDGLKLFNFTSVEFISHNDTILYGLFLCGKYLSTKKIKQLDFSTIPLDKRGFYNINIKVLEKDKKEPIFDENQKLYEVIDINNPIVDIIFGKGIKLDKEIKYIIIIENLENEKYSDIWVGNVHKKLISGNKQSIRCNNNSGNIFDFYMPQEHHSDFNEFEQGIIEGILYGN